MTTRTTYSLSMYTTTLHSNLIVSCFLVVRYPSCIYLAAFSPISFVSIIARFQSFAMIGSLGTYYVGVFKGYNAGIDLCTVVNTEHIHIYSSSLTLKVGDRDD